MIGTMHIRLSAARPNLPLGPYHVFAGSAASFTIVDLPRPLGVRKIESVTLVAKSVAGVTTGYAATRVGSAWGVTVPAGFFATSGFVARGIVIEAGGIDDNGAPVTPWILGAADLVVMERDGSIAPGETSHAMHWHDTRPEHPAAGDVAPHDGGVFYFNGSEWVEIGGGGDTTWCLKLDPDTGNIYYDDDQNA